MFFPYGFDHEVIKGVNEGITVFAQEKEEIHRIRGAL
jgi:hypothetical protein